jgi:hypothetical protein
MQRTGTQVGRVIRAEKDRFGSGDAVVVIGHAFWKRQLGGDASVVGATIHLNARLLVDRHSINPGALTNLGIPLLRGRDLTWQTVRRVLSSS